MLICGLPPPPLHPALGLTGNSPSGSAEVAPSDELVFVTVSEPADVVDSASLESELGSVNACPDAPVVEESLLALDWVSALVPCELVTPALEVDDPAAEVPLAEVVDEVLPVTVV